MTFSVSRRCLALGITAAALATTLTACTPHAPGDTGRLQEVLDSCPTDQKILAYEALDGSATSNDEAIVREHLKHLEADVERVAVCDGHLTVVAFGTNSVTAPIYDGDLALAGSTDIAKLRRVPDAVAEIMAEVTKNYEPAVASLPEGGTDVTGLLRLLGEAQELRPDMQLQSTIQTDGLTNQGVVIDHALTPAEAEALADQVPVPDLSGSMLSVVGIGRVAGDPLPSNFLDGLKAFYTRLCANTKADTCLVVTDGR